MALVGLVALTGLVGVVALTGLVGVEALLSAAGVPCLSPLLSAATRASSCTLS